MNLNNHFGETLKRFIYSRTRNYNIYIPLESIKANWDTLKTIDADLFVLLKKETANG